MSDPAKLREALQQYTPNPAITPYDDVERARLDRYWLQRQTILQAARDYLALLESDAIVIRREDGHWPDNAYRVVNAYLMRAATTRSVNAADVAGLLDALADAFKAEKGD